MLPFCLSRLLLLNGQAWISQVRFVANIQICIGSALQMLLLGCSQVLDVVRQAYRVVWYKLNTDISITILMKPTQMHPIFCVGPTWPTDM